MRKLARRQVVKHVDFQDLDLAIEFPRGSKRPYRDNAGKEQFKTMHADYGEVVGTEGLDGDPVDVYVGLEKASPKVFVVTQMTKGDWDKVDEEKCILGVNSARQAKELYLKHYNDDRFCGAIKELTMDQFKQRLATKGQVGQKIASAAQRIAELNYLRMQEGASVLVQQRHGIKVGAAEFPKKPHPGGQVEAVPAMTLFGETQPGAKVAVDWAARLKTMRARQDPDGIKQAGIDPQWASDIAPDVKAKMRKEDPGALEFRRVNSLGETPVTKMEQRGLGISESRIKDDPKDAKLRKAASAVLINHFVKSAKSHLGERAAVLGGGAAGAVGAHELAKRHGHKVLGYAPSRGQLGTALLLGGMGGAQLTRAAIRDMNKKADDERAKRIGHAVDDVGIAALASPYIGAGLGKHLAHRPGRLGAIGRAGEAYGKAFGSKNRNEIASLALVGHTGTKLLGKGIDRALPTKKTAGIGNTMLGLAKTVVQRAPGAVTQMRNTIGGVTQRAAQAAKTVVPGATQGAPAAAPGAAAQIGKGLGRVAGAAIGLGAAGTMAGMYGAKKLLGGHSGEVAAPAYQPPRLY